MTIIAGIALVGGMWLRGPVAGTASAGAIPTPSLLGPGTGVLSTRLVPLTGSVIPHLATARQDIAVPASKTIGVDVSLKLRDGAGLDRYLEQLYDRTSPLYHHFLTPRQFRERFAQTPAEEGQVVSWMKRQGLQVKEQFSNGLLITATGNVGQIDNAFGTRLYTFHQKAHTFFANAAPLHLPAWVASHVSAVDGLSNRDHITVGVPHPDRPLRDLSDGISPKALGSAYDLDGFYGANANGTGVTVGIAADGDVGNADFSTFERQWGLNTSIQRVPVKDPNGTKAPAVDTEFEMDTEIVSGIAPGARILLYQDTNPHSSGDIPLFNTMVTDNKADIITTSMSTPEGAYEPSELNARHAVFQEAAAQGQTVFSSTGDFGAYSAGYVKDYADTLMVRYPASDPYVTGVGGTTLTLNGDGSYGSEKVWGDPTDNSEAPKGSGGGGGLSGYFPRPGWQQGPGTDNGYSNGKREVPDVSAVADPNQNTSMAIYEADTGDQSGPGWSAAGGTSASTPLWAAFTALLDNAGGGRIGFLNPTLYALAQHESQFQYPAFHDITTGNNLYYPATPGYDLASGLGSFDGAALYNDISAMGGPVNGAPPPVPTPSPTSTPVSHPTSSGISITGTGINHVVSGKWKLTHSIHLQEPTLFDVAYKSSATTTVTGNLRLWYNNHWYAWQKMPPVKYSDGARGFELKLRFRHANRLGTWYVRFYVQAGSATAAKNVKFTVTR